MLSKDEIQINEECVSMLIINVQENSRSVCFRRARHNVYHTIGNQFLLIK